MTIRTAKGRDFETNHVSFIDGKYCWIKVINSDMQTVRTVFNDPEETCVLTYGSKVYRGYTKLDYITEEGNALKVRLAYG